MIHGKTSAVVYTRHYGDKVRLTVMVKLLPSGSQREALKATLRRVNEACDYASGVAWDKGTYANKYRLQQVAYHDIKERFGLTAQVVIRLLAKVADAYKLDRRTKRTFRPLGAIAYDDRILRWYSGANEVSIWTTEADSASGLFATSAPAHCSPPDAANPISSTAAASGICSRPLRLRSRRPLRRRTGSA
jgi:predicted transposase